MISITTKSPYALRALAELGARARDRCRSANSRAGATSPSSSSSSCSRPCAAPACSTHSGASRAATRSRVSHRDHRARGRRTARRRVGRDAEASSVRPPVRPATCSSARRSRTSSSASAGRRAGDVLHLEARTSCACASPGLLGRVLLATRPRTDRTYARARGATSTGRLVAAWPALLPNGVTSEMRRKRRNCVKAHARPPMISVHNPRSRSMVARPDSIGEVAGSKPADRLSSAALV